MAVCWIDGKHVSPQQATVSVFDHGLLYGDGVFEGIRFYNKQVFKLDAHLRRLRDSAKAIALSVPYSDHELRGTIHELVDQYELNDGYIRLLITRGKGSLGINPQLCEKSTTILIVDQISIIEPKSKECGLKLIISHTRRLPPDGLDSRIKSLNYLNSILSKIEANQAGADEAILLNSNGYVCEGSSDNLFIVKNNKLLTPPVSDGALDGITRSVILNLALELDIDILVSSITAYDLYTAEECFLSGTAAELLPVREIDGRELLSCPGPVFTQLQSAFSERVRQPAAKDQYKPVVMRS